MTRFVQLHILTAYPPSNLNRDDLGRPKTAIVGGATRLRISSQANKRAFRTSDVFASALAGHMGRRTQRFGEIVRDHLKEAGTDEKKAVSIARQVAGIFGEPKDERGPDPVHIKQLAFISDEEHRAALVLADRLAAGEKIDIEKEAKKSVLQRTDTAADIGMFGRMLAADPDFNREAAVQVSHAFTTHRAVIEDDYYTAVDDLKKRDTDAGAGFVGEAGFGAGVFYLYLCIDTDLLVRNLSGDRALAATATAALIDAATSVAPSGKQASFASRARAGFVLCEDGTAQPRSLASAFLKPVDANEGAGSMMRASIDRLADAREAIDQAYGPIADRAVTMDVEGRQGTLADVIAFSRSVFEAPAA